MNDVIMMTEKQIRFRMGYDFLPVLEGSAPAKKGLNILIAWPSLNQQQAERLAFIQYAKWYCEDIIDQIDLSITLYVPQNAEAVRATFDSFGIEYEIVLTVDERNVDEVAELALALDCDLVLTPEPEALAVIYTDEVGLVSSELSAATHTVAIHMRGFDVPWSFEAPFKNMPWSSFYLIGELSTFQRFILDHGASRAAGSKVHEVMRSLVYDALPSLCRSRDRLEFYRQQGRWAQRQGLKRQDFTDEYAAFLNHFYLTYYAAVDQIAALVVHLFKMRVPERNIGATYRGFREARKTFPALDAVFCDKVFWDMYKLPTLIRHHAAHRGPVKPADVYHSDGKFTDEQIQQTMEEHGLMENVRFFERVGIAPQEVVEHARSLAREEARRILMGPPRRHGVFLIDGKKGLFYYPDPAQDFNKLVAFFDRVLAVVKPWPEAEAT